MKVVVQRVTSARVSVAGQEVAQVANGFLLLVGVSVDDTEAGVAILARKIAGLRIFEDADGKMNLGLEDTKGEVLAVPQFTLLGDCRRGRRPDFMQAARPEQGQALFEMFCRELENAGCTVRKGAFQEHMQVELTNDGPVTLILDSKELKR